VAAAAQSGPEQPDQILGPQTAGPEPGGQRRQVVDPEGVFQLGQAAERQA
jgi:hypothetical protein